MKDKEKQIEEILCFMDTNISAKKIAELIPSKIVSYDGRSKGQHLYIEQKMEIAKEMMKQGAVVLSREEINEKQNEAWDRGIEFGKEIARKETAEKILKDLWTEFEKPVFWADNVAEIIKELAKQFGVEIKE